MILIDVFALIFVVVFLTATITTVLTIPEQLNTKDFSPMDQGKSDVVKEKRWEKRIRNSLFGVMLIGLLLGFLLLYFRFRKYSWIILFFSLEIYLEYAIDAYKSVSVLKNIVMSNEDQPLSRQENNALLFVSAFLCVLNMMRIPENVIKLITACTYDILADVLLCIFYVLLIFSYSFLSFVFLPKIIYNFLCFRKRRHREEDSKSRSSRFRNYFLSCLSVQKRPEELTICLIKFLKVKNRIFWKIGYIFIPLIYVIDLGVLLIWNVYAILCRIIGYILRLIVLLRNSILKGVLWILQLTTKRAVAIIFRISIILALIFVVAWNRYHPFFRLFDSSTAVFEFIASAIIIPIMFEWIISAKHVDR